METCKIYKITYYNDEDDIQESIEKMLKQGWSVKHMTSSPVKESDDGSVIIAIIFEKSDKPKQTGAID